MRRARLVGTGRSYYHCMSRVIERRFVLGAPEREKFKRLMRAVEAFSGVKVLTYAILSNHFHILLEVPDPEELSDEQLLDRIAALYSKGTVLEVGKELKGYREEKDDKRAEALRNRYICRMYDVSEFMKTLKQRYTQWWNKARGRRGTLWEQRFKSVLLEGRRGHALVTMAAYIDLNAVRAGLVEDPKEYRHCGYGEAVAGGQAGQRAREGLKEILRSVGPEGREWRQVRRDYRKQLYLGGAKRLVVPGGDRKGKAVFAMDTVQKVLDEGGKLSRGQLLHCRVRYLTDGAVLGSREFVEAVWRKNRKQFGHKRKTGARLMRGGDWGELCTARDLRLSVISVPG